MAKRRRAASRSGLVGRAVSVGRRALKEAESRVPPDLRRQLERRLKDADKTARVAIKQLQAQVKKASTRADVNSVLQRIDGLTKQARQIAQGSGTRAAPTRRRATTTTKRAAGTAKKAVTAGQSAASRRAGSTPRASGARTTRRTPARRSRPAPASTPAASETPSLSPEDGGGMDMGEGPSG